MITLSPSLQLSVTVSIGVASLEPGMAEADGAIIARELVSRADGLLYAAKESGRNRVISFRAE